MRFSVDSAAKSILFAVFFGTALLGDNLFNYTSGRWVYNDALRHKERKLVFNVDGLRRLAAESIDQNPADVVSLSKLAEGAFNRTFAVSFRNGKRVIARVPYPVTAPKYFAIASEVATIEYLRSRGIPAPAIFGYSADENNAAGTPYILMEYVQGSKLGEVWSGLKDEEVISVVRQLTQLESRMMALPFPAGGNLYFTKDLEKVAPGLGVPLEDRRFCVGPDTTLALWYGRRAELDDVDRGPYQSVEAALVAGAHKEIAYLKQFGRPILPIRRERRPAYKFQPQLPSTHVELLGRYLSIASAIVPEDPALNRFCLRHPDFNLGNIFVSRSPDSGQCKVVSLIDWQHTSILPMFLLAGVPHRFQNYGDSVSDALTPPPLQEDPDDADDDLYRRRLVHYHYVTSTRECNPVHYAAFTDPLHDLRTRLFTQAGAPWEGESFDLKDALIQGSQKWGELTGRDVPRPLEFDDKDLREMEELSTRMSRAMRFFDLAQGMGGVGEDGWVANEDYESAVAFLQECKEERLAAAKSAEKQEEILAHWPWDDRDEEM
ncbi:kinase-like domain-containing protein [Trametes polyzona]|nr:kinase-like domain-containing protein [Trametes polyzona]